MIPKATPMAMVTRPRTIEFVEREIPSLSGDEVLIEVKACAVCGSDLHLFHDRHPFVSLPSALGHEISGVVIDTGDLARRFQAGDPVVVEPVIACGRCEACLKGRYHLCVNITFQYREGQGGFTRYFMVRQRWLHPIPEGLDFDLASLSEPLAVVLHAIDKAGLKRGESVCIYGDGPIGLLLTAALRRTLASLVFLVGHRKDRLQIGRELEAVRVFDGRATDPEEIRSQILRETGGRGVRAFFEASGGEKALREGLSLLAKGGSAILLGLQQNPSTQIDGHLLMRNELSIRGSQGYCWDFPAALRLLRSHPKVFGALITHSFPLKRLQEALELLSKREEQTAKIIIHPE